MIHAEHRFTPPACARLPIVFDAPALLAEALAFEPSQWLKHFNTDDPGWKGAALRTPGGVSGDLYIDPALRKPPLDTALMARCPRIAAELTKIQSPIRAVRLLMLEAGSVIHEHRDQDLVFGDGEARLHVPLATNPNVEFYVDNTRVIMEPGECWYLDLSRPHRVSNRGAADRIHLVIDCQVNEWLLALVARSSPVERVAAAPSGQESFAAFRARMFESAELQAELMGEADPGRFAALCVGLGRARGFDFAEQDVRAAMSEGRRSWNSRSAS